MLESRGMHSPKRFAKRAGDRARLLGTPRDIGAQLRHAGLLLEEEKCLPTARAVGQHFRTR